uniref:Uncharacterized protein n=1 Tax=Lepeophtheirus salmonis TaxID=72036 RepID=A0A0K2V133_LEPSM
MSKRFPVLRFNKLMGGYRAMRQCVVIKENYLVLPGFIFWAFLEYCTVRFGQLLLVSITINGLTGLEKVISYDTHWSQNQHIIASSFLPSKSPIWYFSNDLKHCALH